MNNHSKDSNTAILMTRIKRNYEEYKKEILELGSECIFESAAEIALYTEIYERMTTENHYMTEETLEFILRFENPLQLLVKEWNDYTIISGIDLAYFLDIIAEETDEKNYLTVSEAAKLRDKHGTDNTADAVFSEMMKLLAKYLGIKGAEFCKKD